MEQTDSARNSSFMMKSNKKQSIASKASSSRQVNLKASLLNKNLSSIKQSDRLSVVSKVSNRAVDNNAHQNDQLSKASKYMDSQIQLSEVQSIGSKFANISSPVHVGARRDRQDSRLSNNTSVKKLISLNKR